MSTSPLTAAWLEAKTPGQHQRSTAASSLMARAQRPVHFPPPVGPGQEQALRLYWPTRIVRAVWGVRDQAERRAA